MYIEYAYIFLIRYHIA